jgi:diacylglycerol kinase family enzyme
MAEAKRHVVIVCNPTKKGIETVRKHVDVFVAKHGYSRPTWIATGAKDGGYAAAQRALAKNPDLVLVVGGDGTLRVVADVLRGTGVPIGIIPRGTGNLLARNLHLPITDVKACVRIAFEGHSHDIDVAHATTDGPMGKREAIFLVMAGIGLDAAMAALTNPKLKARIGWLAYIAPILQAALRNEKKSLTVVLENGQHARRRQHTAIIGNCGVLTGGFLLMPEAKLDDGLLDVLALDPQTAWGWTRILRRVAVGSAVRNSPNKTQILRGLPDIKSMRYRQAPRIEWHMDEPVLVQIDGDTFGEVSSAVVTAIPRCLTVRVADD